MDSSDSSPTETITVFNSNMQPNSHSQTETKTDLQNNNDSTSKRKEILDNERKHVTEMTQPELFNLDVARKAEDSKKFGCSNEGIVAGVVVPFPGNIGDITPPIVVELWDEPNLAGNYINTASKIDSHEQTPTADDNMNNTLTSSQYLREEREPTPFFRNDDTKVSTLHLDDKSKQRGIHIPTQNLSTETTKEFHRELTPFYESKNLKQLDSADLSVLSLGVPDPGVFQRESTPFYKDVSLKSQPSLKNNNSTDLSTSLAVPVALAENRDTRESTPYFREKDPYAEYHFRVGLEAEGVREDKTKSNEGTSLGTCQPKELRSMPDTSAQTHRPKLQSISPQDFTLGLQVEKPTHSKTPQLARPTLKSPEHIEPRPIKSKSPETLASQTPSTLEMTKKPSLFTSSPTINPVLAFDPEQSNKHKQSTAGQLPDRDKQTEKQTTKISRSDSSKSSEGNKTDTKILSPDSSNTGTPQTVSAVSQTKQSTSGTQQNLDQRQQTPDLGETERKLNTELQETAKRVRKTPQSKVEHESQKPTQTLHSTQSSLYTKQAQISDHKLSTLTPQIEHESQTHKLHQPESSKLAKNKNTNLEIQKQATDVSKSQTEKKIQPSQTEDLPHKTPQVEKVTARTVQVKVAPTSTQKTSHSTSVSQLKEVKTEQKSSLDDQAANKQESNSNPLVNSEVQIVSLVQANNSDPPSQSIAMVVSVDDASHPASSTPHRGYPIMFQETKEAQQEVAPIQLLVSAKNIYPVEIVAKESSNQTTGILKTTNETTDTLKTTNQTTAKLESANQINRISEETAMKKKKKEKSGFSNSLSNFFNSKRKTDKTDKTDKTEKTDNKSAKEKTKRSVFSKSGNKHKTANVTSPAEAEPKQEQRARQQLVSRQTLTKCSPFGPYTLEGFCFLFVLTIFCLHIQLSIEKFVCYVLAAFYTFCVMRLLGVIY